MRGSDRASAEVNRALRIGAEGAGGGTEEAREAPILQTDVVVVVEVIDSYDVVTLLEEQFADT